MINTEIINLKIALAKEKSVTRSLTEELQTQKERFEEEIKSMQQSVEMQTNIINELTEKCETMKHLNRALDNSVELIEAESDLNDSAWSIIDSNSCSDENLKIVVQLASEVDQLNDKIEETRIELNDSRKMITNIKMELQAEKVKNEDLIDVQSDLARDILDLKVSHELELGMANVQLKKHAKKTKSLKSKMHKLQRGADDFISTSIALHEYDIIC